ncbi:polynucleotide adenylyltransferase PcnB [Congregibacter variabilis]|uniref:Poly(A) polymerase I n=1 Tax=Congregibacter variabilis TaxID=3081200 RepID=A0ABZ0HZ75_9GAMM|nr:polynucleotide adenylyltransferase PcnB [Congregibacter sp. IMCC43200]
MKVIPRDQHCVSRKDISPGALKVMSRLRDREHQAYLVGGAVRDLLLGGHPKDFDIATDATPEEVHALFGNSRIIGRRFRIVHVRFGREIIEVTTFRGHHDDGDSSDPAAKRSSRGLLLRDNVFGTLEEDAVRRDLTVNALYYDSGSFEVFDQVGGLNDLESRQVRVIGDPAKRYREDPVRMLRTLRFAAKLDFRVEKGSGTPIAELASLLDDIPSARLFDEFGKLFLAGNAQATLRLLREYRCFDHLFPGSARLADENPFYHRLLDAAMGNTDLRIRQGKPVTPAFILAAVLWPAVCERRQQLEGQGEKPVPAMHSAGQEIVAQACQRIAIPRRFSMPMREIWEMQLRLPRTEGKRALELMSKRRFRAAYDFLLLREQAGEDCAGLGATWTRLQEEHGPIEIVDSPEDHRPPRRRRRGGRRRPAPDA